MKNSISLLMTGAAIIVVGLGCSKLTERLKVDLFAGDNAVKAAAKIKEKVGAERVKVIRIEMHRDEMEVTIQSAANPKDIDKYTYSGGAVTGPEPVKVLSLGSHDMTGDRYQTTEIGDIGFAAIPETIKNAIEASKIESGKVDLISMEFDLPKGGTLGETPLVFTWRIFVEGPRGSKSLWADKDGKLTGRSV